MNARKNEYERSSVQRDQLRQTAEKRDSSQQAKLDDERLNPGLSAGGTGGTGAEMNIIKKDLSQPEERKNSADRRQSRQS